jgi:hypothetical protein
MPMATSIAARGCRFRLVGADKRTTTAPTHDEDGDEAGEKPTQRREPMNSGRDTPFLLHS